MMHKQKKRKRREYGQVVQFEVEVLRTPKAARPDLLAWLRRWRRQPERLFWVADETGKRRQV
jgi:hypothetical protein